MTVDLAQLQHLIDTAAHAGPGHVLVCGPEQYDELKRFAAQQDIENRGPWKHVPQIPLGVPVVMRPDGGELHVERAPKTQPEWTP